VTEQTLARARAGDEDAFRELTDPHRRELQLHVYRIVGSVQDAEDLLQETLLAAWRGLELFEERASVRTWLYRIATNRSLDALRASRRRPDDLQRMTEVPEPTRRAEPIWLEPYPDLLVEGIPDEAPGPEALYETKEAIALAFVVGLQHLPPQQRAVLVLRDVLGFRAREVAEMLDTSEPSVNSLLRRARAAFESRLPAAGRERAPLPNSELERDIVGRLTDAFEVGDIDAVVALLTDDAWLTMPPEPYEYEGRVAIGAFLNDRAVRRGAPLRLVPTRANGQPAFGCYFPSPQTAIARPYGLLILTLQGDQTSAMTWFADSSVFPAPRTAADAAVGTAGNTRMRTGGASPGARGDTRDFTRAGHSESSVEVGDAGSPCRCLMRAPSPPRILAGTGLRMPSAPRLTRWRPSTPCEGLASSRRGERS
jgi:RNA polymerase sigma-70 factor (TIGR02960 family)